jgi:hypothetical protein
MLLVKYLNKILYNKYHQENYEEEEIEANNHQQHSNGERQTSRKRKQIEPCTGSSSSSSSSASSSVTGHGAAAALGTTTLFDRNGFVRVVGADYSTSIKFFDQRKFSRAIEMNNHKRSSMCHSCIQTKVTKRCMNNFCKCCGKSIQSEIDRKRNQKKVIVATESHQMHSEHSEEELLAEAKIAYFKRRKRMTYSSNNKTIKLEALKSYADSNHATSCCLMNGKALKIRSNLKPKAKKFKTSSSIYFSSVVSSSAHSSKQVKSELSRIKLKKSKAILNINKLKYNPLEFVKQLPSSTLSSIPNDLNRSKVNSVKLVCKLKKTKPIINKRIVNVQKCTHLPIAKQTDSERTPQLQRTCSTFVVDFASTPIKLAPKTSTPIKIAK